MVSSNSISTIVDECKENMSGESSSKSERRRQQNRRAQANLRRKRQERLQDLEQQIAWLEAQTQPLPETEMVCSNDDLQRLDQVSSQPHHEQDPGIDSFPYMPTSILSHLTDNDLMIQQKTSMLYPGCSLALSYPDVTASPTVSSSMLRSSSRPSPSFHETSEACRPSSIFYQQLVHCAFDVLSGNASVLGISAERFLSTDSCSPFYSPLQSYESIAASVVHVPPELQPTMAQLSYPHQPWIDCVPVPDLRSRIIFAVSHRPPLLCSLDIWHDVLSDRFPRNNMQDTTHTPSPWALSESFMKRWQMLLTLELKSLEAMCLKSNPPVRLMSLHSS